MFNRLLNRIADAGKANPSRDESLNGEEISSPDDVGTDVATEGFLCPSCMLGFPSPETLQDHYETGHINTDTTGSENISAGLHVCSACRMRLGSAVELESHFSRHHTTPKNQELLVDGLAPGTLKQDLDELRTTLKEERWYSDELKREVSRLQSTLEFGKEDGDKKSDVEVFYQSQIKVLEESKHLALSEVLLLKEHLNDSREELSRIRQDKDKLEQKAATMAGDLANLKSRLDETSGERFEFENQLRDSQKQIVDLQAEVEQRLGSEDALLLRQELVTVQNLMDQLTLEKENEKDKLQKVCDKLHEENLNLKAALEDAPDLAEIERQKSVVLQLRDSLSQKERENKDFRTEMKNQVSELEQASAGDLAKAREEHEKAESKINELRESLEESSRSLADFKHASNAHLQESHSEHLQQLLAATSLSQKLEQKLGEQESKIRELGQQLELAQTKLQEKEISVQELTEELESNSSKQHSTQTELQERKEAESKALTELEKLKDQIQRLETERTELYEKIEAGDGAKTAIQQLQQENLDLQEKLNKIKETNSEAEIKSRQNLEELNLSLKHESDKRQKTEKEANSLRSQLAEFQTQASQLTSKVSELKSKATSKEDELSELKSQNARQKLFLEQAVSLKNLEIQKMTQQIDSINSSLSDAKAKLLDEHNQYSELKKTLDLTRNDLEKANSLSETTLNKAKEEIASLQSLLKNSKERETKVCDELALKVTDLESARVELSQVTGNLEQSVARIDLLKRDLDGSREEGSNLKEEIQHLGQQSEDARKNLTNAKDEISELKRLRFEDSETRKSLELAKSELSDKLKEQSEDSRMRVSKLEEELVQTREQLGQASQREIESADLITQLKQQCNALMEDVTQSGVKLGEVTSLKDSLEIQNREKTAELQNRDLQLQEREEKRQNLERTLIACQEEWEDERQKAEQAKAILLEEKGQLQLELEDSVRHCRELEVGHNTIVEQLRQKESRQLEEIDQIRQKIEKKDLALKESQRVWEENRSQQEARAGVLSENLSTLQQDLSVERNKRETLESKVDDLGGSKLELEAKLENALDERRALLDRCLRSEDEGEKLRSTTSELRHKLDDTLAALHELGRENQSLQIENTKLLQRKWAEDAEVTHCTACRKQFTVTVRKHHCRSCGSIFCNECSSKTATIASYKKAVRVCDVCFDEVGQ